MMKLRREGLFIYPLLVIKLANLASETSLNQRAISVQQGQNKGNCP